MSAVTTLKYVDWQNFPKILGELIRDDPEFTRSGVPIRYTATFPKTAQEAPCIVYRLLRRSPGMDGIERYKPRVRAHYANEDGSQTEVRSQWMTCLYQFDVCCESGDDADRMVGELDRLIRNSVGFFLDLGCSELVFDEQLIDAMLTPTQNLEVRSLRWMARLENLEMVNFPALQEVRVRVFDPQEDKVAPLTRGTSTDVIDFLPDTYVSQLLYVSDPSPSGIARQEDYLEDLDFQVIFDPATKRTALRWIEPGRRPLPGATYYVRYLHWTAWSRLKIPF